MCNVYSTVDTIDAIPNEEVNRDLDIHNSLGYFFFNFFILLFFSLEIGMIYVSL
jgi:hypothetical protein